jgi:hypothetical protein
VGVAAGRTARSSGIRGVGVDGEQLVEAARVQVRDVQSGDLVSCRSTLIADLQSVRRVQARADLVNRGRNAGRDRASARSEIGKRLSDGHSGLLMTNCSCVMPFRRSASRICAS